MADGSAPAEYIEADIFGDDTPNEIDLAFGLDETADDEEDELDYEWNDANLARTFSEHPKGKEFLREAALKVYDDFEDAWDTTAEYRDRASRDWKLFSGELPKKSFPWTNSANSHVPLMLENLLRLTSRVESELFGDFSRIYGVIPLSPDDRPTADILTAHGNWQFREEIPDFSRQMSRGILAFFVIGDVTGYSFYNPETRTNSHEVLTIDDFVVPYVHVTTMPDYSDCPYYVRILRLYRHQVEARRTEWFDVDKLLDEEPPSWEEDPEALFRESIAETTGISSPDVTSAAPYTILQYEGWMDLPGQDRQRFCQVFMDYDTRVILKFTIHEEPEWRDKIRFERETEELRAYRKALVAFEIQEVAWDLSQAKGRSATVDPALSEIERDQRAALLDDMDPPSLPLPPQWMDDPEDADEAPSPVRFMPRRMFSHGVCIENLAGAHGLSFGRMQADFNRSANTLVSQFIDAGTMANCWGLLTTELIDFEDPFEFAPGKINRVSGVTGQELKGNIMELKPAPANPQMLQMADKVYEWSSKAVQSPAVLSGEAGKSGETFRGLQSRIEQATKQIAVPSRRLAVTWLKQIIQNNGRLNAIHLPEQQMVAVLDPNNPDLQAVEVRREMYARDYRVSIRADMRFTSEAQRISESMELVQLPNTVPAMQPNIAFIHAAVAQYLKARGNQDMVSLLGPAPPPPQTPFGVPPPAPPALPGAPAGGDPAGGGGIVPGVPEGNAPGGPPSAGPPVPPSVSA